VTSIPIASTGYRALTVPTRSTFRPIDLSSHLNNRGMSMPDDTRSGQFNVWGNSFPADHLPPPGSQVDVGGIPFILAGPSPEGDNVRCAGQFIEVPADQHDWIHLLAASERRTEDTVALHFAEDAVDFEALRVSDFWAEAGPAFGGRLAFQTPVMHYPFHVQRRVSALMWHQRIPIARYDILVGLRLPRNIAIHIFALTVQSSDLGEER
jgi:hypothetical protein